MEIKKWLIAIAAGMALSIVLIHVCEAKDMPSNKNVISNKFMKVELDVSAHSFSIFPTGYAGEVVTAGTFPFLAGALKKGATGRITDKKYGGGTQAVVEGQGGNAVTLILYDNIPFLFIKTRIGALGSETAVFKSIKAVRFPVALKAPYEQIRIQGTGFLTTPDKNPGSYVFMAVADKETNHGFVSAWLTENRGSGIIKAEKSGLKAVLNAQIDYGALRVASERHAEGETLVMGYFDDARLGLEQYADLVAREYDIRIRPPMDGYCSWYSSPNGGANDESNLKILAKSSETLLKPYGLKFIQIDDMWQAGERRNGPAKNFYAHKKGIGPYPHGMKAAADNLKKLGFVPGIWWMPFAGDQRDPFFMKHEKWFVKNKDGKPYETEWGGTSLDMTNPEARDYVKSVAAQLSAKWGYEYFKMDGLYTGIAVRQQYVNHEYQPDDIGEAVFFNPDKTNIEAFRDGLKLVREAVGKDVFFLGCTVAQNMRSFGATFGLVDAMRVGEDNGPAWDSEKKDLLAGPRAASNRYFLNGRVWWNDPDPVYIRPSIPIEHARLISSWVGLTGQMMTYSEWLPEMPADRTYILQRIMPNHGLKARPMDYFESYIPRVWTLTDKRASVRRDVLGLFNWDSESAATFKFEPEKAGLPAAESYIGFDFWNDKFIEPFTTIDFEVPKGDCRIIAVKPVADRPQVISSNRHITQGIVDIENESWDGNAISGFSDIVGGEAYELRVIAPEGKVAWKLKKIYTDNPKVETSFKQDGLQIRVMFKSETSVKLKWHLEFGKDKVAAN
ncbi:MAG: alpha-galactosidase [bacterium]